MESACEERDVEAVGTWLKVTETAPAHIRRLPNLENTKNTEAQRTQRKTDLHFSLCPLCLRVLSVEFMSYYEDNLRYLASAMSGK